LLWRKCTTGQIQAVRKALLQGGGESIVVTVPTNAFSVMAAYPGYFVRSKILPMSALVLPAVVGFRFDGVNGQPAPMGIPIGVVRSF